MKRLAITLAILVIGFNSPIFSHRYTDGAGETWRVHYSLWDAIEMDISERQFTLPISIVEDLF